MKIAVIDMGTNTFHLLIVDVKENGEFTTIYREKTAVKIGENGINRGLITDEAIERAITALENFKIEIDKQSVASVHATATSAIRNANNGHHLIDLIEAKTGIKAEIISGDREAELIYYGVTHALDTGNTPCLIMDIGGGSIEFVIAHQQKIYWKKSFEIGGQRMVEKFHDSDPIQSPEINKLETFLYQELTELFDECAKYQPSVLIGSSGTFDTLSDIYCKKSGVERKENQTELPFEIPYFEPIYQELISKNRDERLKIPGMIPLRVDMIVVASVLVKFVIDSLDIKQLRVSAYALKEGVLLKTIHSFVTDTKLDE